MSLTSASSAKKSVKKSLVWAVSDGVLAVGLSIVLPVALAFLMLAAARIGIIPHSWGEFLLQDSPTAQVGQYLVALILEAGIIGSLVWFRKAKRTDLGLQRFQWRWLAYTVALYILLIFVGFIANSIVKVLWPVVDLDQVQNVYPFGHATWAVYLSFVTSVLIAPIVEETLFRGLLFGSLANRFSAILAAIVSSAIFAVLHGQLNVMIYTFCLGLILCWLYKRSGSILPGILLHLLNNVIAFWAITSGR